MKQKKSMCTKCWQAEENVTMYFGIIYERMNHSHKEQPVIGILFPYFTGKSFYSASDN